jgi:hypothetical protein
MTEQTKTTFEPIVLDRFEYTLPKGEYVVYKESSGFLYKMKHTKKEFDSEEKVLKFIEDMLKERKRYQQLLKTLSVPELNKLFSDVTLLGLTPAQIKEYEVIEQFEYTLVVDDEWGYAEKCKDLQDVKELVSDKLGISFNWYLDLKDNEDNTVVRGGYYK